MQCGKNTFNLFLNVNICDCFSFVCFFKYRFWNIFHTLNLGFGTQCISCIEFILNCRTVSVQKSCTVFGLLLLGVCGRLPLFGMDSCLCSGWLLYGLRVNIYHQLRTAFHQPETKASNWRKEGEVWIEFSTNKSWDKRRKSIVEIHLRDILEWQAFIKKHYRWLFTAEKTDNKVYRKWCCSYSK